MALQLTKDQMLLAYEKMLLLRRFEEKCGQIYGMGQIGGFCHLYIGQEPIIVANMLAKRPSDSTITSYRCHAHAIISGDKPESVLAELMGKASGSSKGKGGSMHLFNVAGNYYGGHGIVGAQVSLGTGLAFASKYKGNQDICYTFMGDGAVNQGQVYESFNMASLWKLPIVYIIENNQYSMGTSVERSTSVTDLHKKGISFGIQGKAVDAMNLEEVYNAYLEASEFARSGNGPFILEMKTYRYRGHSMSDPAKYRTKEEVDSYKAMDPIESLEKIILHNNYLTSEQLKIIQNKIKADIQEIVDLAQNAPEPKEEELYTDVYSGI
jgi:pyruvate dehydrogenase E1 component alpha subunit